MLNVIQVKANGKEVSEKYDNHVEAFKFAKKCERDAERRGVDEVRIEDPESGCLWYVCTGMFVYLFTVKGVHPFWCSTRQEAKDVITEERDSIVEFSVELRTAPEYGSQNWMFERELNM